MNKLELIDTLKNECQITKKEATAIEKCYGDGHE